MKVYRIFQFLGLDIVLGALAMSFFVSQLMDAMPGWTWYLALGATMWLLYTGDRMLDAWRNRERGLREIHYFLLSHRRPILYALGIVLILDSYLCFNIMSKDILKTALILAVLVFLFFAMRHVFRRKRVLNMPGELFVLVFYLAGVSLGGFVFRTVQVGTTHMMVMLMMFGVLLMNLGTISLYDSVSNTRLGITSLTALIGKTGCRFLVLVSGMLVLMLTLLQFLIFGNTDVTRLAFILAGMALILLMILYSPSYFRRNQAYRMAADAVLYLGFLSILV